MFVLINVSFILFSNISVQVLLLCFFHFLLSYQFYNIFSLIIMSIFLARLESQGTFTILFFHIITIACFIE